MLHQNSKWPDGLGIFGVACLNLLRVMVGLSPALAARAGGVALIYQKALFFKE